MKEGNVGGRTKFKNRLDQLSVRTKLVSILLVVSFCTMIASSYISSRLGEEILLEKVFDQLNSLRGTSVEQLDRYFKLLIDQTETLSDDFIVVSAMKDFKQAFDNLATVDVPKEYDKKLEHFYSTEFIPRLKKRMDAEPIIEAFMPKTTAARYIQYHYIANNPNPVGQKFKLDNPKDGSEYSAVNVKYKPKFSKLAERFGYQDLYLIDPQGNVVYSFANNVDKGINLLLGPTAESNLSKVFQDCRSSNSTGYFKVADFQPYIMSYNRPAAFVCSPITDKSQLVGVLAFELPTERINEIINHKNKWKENGLGETGEVDLVGQDLLLRSDSRFLIEDREKFLQTLKHNGINDSIIKKISDFNTTILLQPTKSEGIKKALLGNKVELRGIDYRGVEVLGAYAPIDFADLRWAIAAKMDVTEAFATISRFQQNVLIATALIMVVTTVVAMWIARRLVRPIERLIATTNKVEAGDEGAMVTSGTRDEYHDLAREFNKTVYNLRSQIQEGKQSAAESEALIEKLLPMHIAKRLKAGEGVIADAIPSVTVMFTDIYRFTRLSQIMSPEKMVFFLDELADNFDDLMDKYGLEKIKTMGDGYMAACGLSVPHLDNDKRTMDCAIEMIAQVRRLSYDRGLKIDLRVGINSGAVIAGAVGKSRFTYDLWGDTVNTAHRLKAAAPPGGILVSANIHERLIDLYEFEPFRPIAEPGKEALEAWLLSSERKIIDAEAATKATQQKDKRGA